MTALGIVMGILIGTMLISYIVLKHEYQQGQKAAQHYYRHKYDADKQQATDEVAAAYKELIRSEILQ